MADQKNKNAISAWYDETLSLIPNRALPNGGVDETTSKQAEILMLQQPGILSLSGGNEVLSCKG